MRTNGSAPSAIRLQVGAHETVKYTLTISKCELDGIKSACFGACHWAGSARLSRRFASMCTRRHQVDHSAHPSPRRRLPPQLLWSRHLR